MSTEVNITSLSKGSGCGCKINPTVLKDLLQGLTNHSHFENLVVGNNLADDCSVYDLGNGDYLLQTVDFFTPIVNDSYVFGAAAAANALSDIWAMGGRVLMANAVFSWPLDKLPIEQGREVLRGASDMCKKAGIPLAGGHSIDGQEPLMGLSVTGICKAEHLKRNGGAKPGDIIAITKSLGAGMLATAHKRGTATEAQNKALFEHLQQLNQLGEKLGQNPSVHALTDITGFGLAGHLLEMCRASELGAEINAEALPKIEEAASLASSFTLPDNAMRNWNAYEKEIAMDNPSAFPWLIDPQTNGGLLIALSPESEIPDDAVAIGKFVAGNSVIRVY